MVLSQPHNKTTGASPAATRLPEGRCLQSLATAHSTAANERRQMPDSRGHVSRKGVSRGRTLGPWGAVGSAENDPKGQDATCPFLSCSRTTLSPPLPGSRLSFPICKRAHGRCSIRTGSLHCDGLLTRGRRLGQEVRILRSHLRVLRGTDVTGAHSPQTPPRPGPARHSSCPLQVPWGRGPVLAQMGTGDPPASSPAVLSPGSVA